MKKLPIVLLDLDDTILDFHMAEHVAIKKTFTQLGLDTSDETIERYSEINQAHWEMLEKKQLDRAGVLVGRFKALFDEKGFDADPYEAQELYERLLAIGHYFMPGAEALLESLSGECRMFICSNGTAPVQAGRIASAGIEKYFERVFISEKLGHNKPSREYFEACFAQIPAFDRARTIILGDSLSSDILGGINAGIKTCRYNPKAKPGREDIIPDYEISSLGEFPELLKSCFMTNL